MHSASTFIDKPISYSLAAQMNTPNLSIRIQSSSRMEGNVGICGCLVLMLLHLAQSNMTWACQCLPWGQEGSEQWRPQITGREWMHWLYCVQCYEYQSPCKDWCAVVIWPMVITRTRVQKCIIGCEILVARVWKDKYGHHYSHLRRPWSRSRWISSKQQYCGVPGPPCLKVFTYVSLSFKPCLRVS